MQIILSFILSIIILISFIYHFKSNKEGMVKVNGDMQPDPKDEIYDFNLRQAQGIWKDVGCTNGSYKPTNANITKWKHEKWREELKAYKTEADLKEKEHNYYDFEGLDDDGVTKLKYVNRDAIGIGEAYERCYKKDFDTNYVFPKPGDRIKIKENTKGTTTDYYSGIVLDGNVEEARPLEVLWDAKGKEGTMKKDTKRTETKIEDVQTNKIKIKEDILEFGWPYQKWNRHPDTNKEWDKFVSEKDWIRMNDMDGKVDSKIVYKSTECSTTTECDNLNCKKRKDEILNRYPITYYCEGDSRNQRELGTGHMCKSGERKGMITQYYDETKMCFKDEKGNIYGRKFALKECGVGNTEEYNGYKNIFGGDCYALISDETSGKGNRAIIGDNKVYNSNDLKNLGLTGGKIMSAQLYGDDSCIAEFDGGETVLKSSGNTVPSSVATKISLRKQVKGCEVVIDNKAATNNIFKDTEETESGVLKGTPYNSDEMVKKGIADDSTKKFTLEGVGGYNNKNCRVAFYPEKTPIPTVIPPNMPEIFKGGDGEQTVKRHSGNVSSMSVYKVPLPVLEPGNYRIKSRRTGMYCNTYKEQDIFGNETGKYFLQCDNKSGNGPIKSDKFTLALINDMDPNGYYISQGQRCKFQKIGLGYNIKCDNEGDNRSLNSQFELSKSGDGYFKIKNKKTRRHCINRRDILMPGGGIIACNGMGNRQWQEYKFEKI